ncbi:MAG: ParA family protein [Lachnospiraceae bacterium]|nr:ParA family protein [Lachnospiraceae bacterium]MBP3753343.1 ParA family protein [Lachnospiraceae bacterium]
MNRILAIANQKGGVGKTCTAVNLSASLGELGKKVLLIDMDPQGNSSSSFGVNKNEVENTIYEVMLEECTLSEAIIKDVAKNVSLVPANVNLGAVEIEMAGKDKANLILRRELDFVKDEYDYIFIDCPPAISLTTVNSMAAATGVIVPVQCEYLALEGLGQVIETINLVRSRMNPTLDLTGILFTMYDGRTVLSNDVVDSVRNTVKYHTFEAKIPRNIRLSEAPSFEQPITVYDPKCSGAVAYMNLAKEVDSMLAD